MPRPGPRCVFITLRRVARSAIAQEHWSPDGPRQGKPVRHEPVCPGGAHGGAATGTDAGVTRLHDSHHTTPVSKAKGTPS